MKEYAEKVELIDTKKITSELLDVLSRHDLAVADAIRMLEMTKNKILVTTKIKPSSHNLINSVATECRTTMQ